MLWLSTRTSPDLAYDVSATTQALTKDLELLKTKLRRLLQYLNTTKTKGCFTCIQRRTKSSLSLPSSETRPLPHQKKHSQSGFTAHRSYGNARHLVHWQSLREPKTAESSAEAELYALASARKSARNFRLPLHESFATSIIMSLRCDNTATIAMLRSLAGGRVMCPFLERQQSKKCGRGQ